MSLYELRHLDQAWVLLLRQTPDMTLPGLAAVIDEGVGEELRDPPVVDRDLPGDEWQSEAYLGQHFRRPGPGTQHLDVFFMSLINFYHGMSLIPSDGAE